MAMVFERNSDFNVWCELSNLKFSSTKDFDILGASVTYGGRRHHLEIFVLIICAILACYNFVAVGADWLLSD